MLTGSALLLPSSPALSTVQVLASVNFAPVSFAFPTDGQNYGAVRRNLQYAWKEIRRWHRSFSILCDEAEDEDILVSEWYSLPGFPARLAHGMYQALQTDARPTTIPLLHQHVFHLLFSSLFIVLNDTSSDSIDKNVRSALQPLREWAGTVIRTEEEYRDFMRNVRVSMLYLYQTLQDIGVSQLSSNRQVAEVNTSMDEVAIFLKLKASKSELSEAQEEAGEEAQTNAVRLAEKGGFMARFFRKMRHIGRQDHTYAT